MEFTIFSNNQGSGYIIMNRDELKHEIDSVEITLNNKIIKPDELTNLDGYFLRKVKFLGIKQGKCGSFEEMLFELGSIKNLFGEKIYIESVFKITETRIFEIFSPDSGRDFNYKNGKWK